MGEPDRVTRRLVDQWLESIYCQLDNILRGPAGEVKARVALLQRRIAAWRDRLGVRRGPPPPR